jgi:hypothetical protein
LLGAGRVLLAERNHVARPDISVDANSDPTLMLMPALSLPPLSVLDEDGSAIGGLVTDGGASGAKRTDGG